MATIGERAQLRERLTEAAERAPHHTVDATLQMLMVAGERQLGAAFAARMLRAIAHLVEVTNERALAAAAGAPSDYAALLELLLQPEALRDLQALGADSLLPARLAGLQARQALLEAGGGAYTAAQMADLLGISRQAVDNRRRHGTLLALTLGKRGNIYPAWQIDEGQVLQGLDVVLAELSDYNPWTRLAFMLNPNTWLDDETPLTELRRGHVERVREAASLYGEQVAA